MRLAQMVVAGLVWAALGVGLVVMFTPSAQEPDPPCERAAACWPDAQLDAAKEPCWRAIEAEAASLGAWRWSGVGRLASGRSLPNGNVLYFGDIMEIQSPLTGQWVQHKYTCTWLVDDKEAHVPGMAPGRHAP